MKKSFFNENNRLVTTMVPQSLSVIEPIMLDLSFEKLQGKEVEVFTSTTPLNIDLREDAAYEGEIRSGLVLSNPTLGIDYLAIRLHSPSIQARRMEVISLGYTSLYTNEEDIFLILATDITTSNKQRININSFMNAISDMAGQKLWFKGEKVLPTIQFYLKDNVPYPELNREKGKDRQQSLVPVNNIDVDRVMKK